MSDYTDPHEIVITSEDISVSDTLKKSMFVIILVIIMAIGYHIFYVEPMIEKLRADSRYYYVVDMELLMDAKINSMIQERERTGFDKSEAEIQAEMKNFANELKEKLLELSSGFPIFSSASVVNARTGIIDLTPEILGQFKLTYDSSFDGNLIKP
jgi:hypothetical protein